MEKSILISKMALILAVILMIGGCSSYDRRTGYDCYTEIVIVPVPVPYPDPYPMPYPVPNPDPGYIEEKSPPRRTPLTRPRSPVNGTSRIKTPRGDHPAHKPLIVRGKGGFEIPPEQVAHSTPKRPPRKR